MQNNHVVIMAGGIGSRFWPMSTSEHPKQFIDVLGCGRTLLQLTVDRFSGLVPSSNFWVVTSRKYESLVKEQLPGIPQSNILLEPCMRNTAPCIAYAGWKIKQRYPDANIVVTSSDHMVTDVDEFRRVIAKSIKFTENAPFILTLGMQPTRPETGYGYIAARFEATDDEIKQVESFKEKPSLSVAEEYLRAGNYFWNAGIFVWNTNTLEKAFRSYCPEMTSVFDSLIPYFYQDNEQEMIDKIFPACDNISIDYAIMEKASDIYVFPASFGWSDLGTWGSLYAQLPHDADGNASVGNNIKMIESNNCIVHIPQGRKVVVQGLDGYIVAEKDGTLLICRLQDEQQIKEFSK